MHIYQIENIPSSTKNEMITASRIGSVIIGLSIASSQVQWKGHWSFDDFLNRDLSRGRFYGIYSSDRNALSSLWF